MNLNGIDLIFEIKDLLCVMAHEPGQPTECYSAKSWLAGIPSVPDLKHTRIIEHLIWSITLPKRFQIVLPFSNKDSTHIIHSREWDHMQGGDTPIYSVLRSSSSVKMKVKGQPPKIADSQKSNCLLAGQESSLSFM